MAFYNPYQPYVPQMMQPAPQPMQQNSGIVPVRSDEEVIRYPVAPGNSITFQHVSEPFIYTKSMGLSQFDKPEIKKYRLVPEGTEAPRPAQEYVTREEFAALKAAVDALGGKNDE